MYIMVNAGEIYVVPVLTQNVLGYQKYLFRPFRSIVHLGLGPLY